MYCKNRKTTIFALRQYVLSCHDFVFSSAFYIAEPKFQLTLNIKTACNFRPVRNCRIRVEYVYSLLTALRQWGGLRHLSKSILASDILRPRKADYFCSVDYSQSSHVAKVLQEI